MKRENFQVFKRVLLVVFLLILGACSSKSKSLDVIANIDYNSIVEEGNSTYFNVNAGSGKTIHFHGINISIVDDEIVMGHDAALFSLDYLGKITTLTMDSSDTNSVLEYGFAYADEANLENLWNLHVAFPYGTDFANPVSEDISHCNTGFLALKTNSSNALCLNKLVIEYDSSVKQTLFGELDENGEIATLFYDYGYTFENQENQVLTETEFAFMKMESPTALYSDILAEIDFSSIQTQGNKTYFNSTMSDGAVVRFEGNHISLDENGMTIYSDSTITSLDALGKIYLYSAQVLDAENYAISNLPDGSTMFENFFSVGYGYTYSSDKTSVESADEVHTFPLSFTPVNTLNGDNWMSVAAFAPNFVYFTGSDGNTEAYVLTSLVVGYDPSEKVTTIKSAKLNEDHTASYLEGELYDQSLENLANDDMKFYLILSPDTEIANLEDETKCIHFVPSSFYTLGDLKDASGNILDKKTAQIYNGSTLDVHLGDSSLTVDLLTLEQYKGATCFNDLLPYAYRSALGQYNTLVVPVVWQDQPEEATQQKWDSYQAILGRVMDENGNVVDYSDELNNQFSLSRYFDVASYGKMQINSFLTDWCTLDYNFEEYQNKEVDKAYADEILAWVKATYPDLDYRRFDLDENGYIDSLILINVGNSNSTTYITDSYGGAVQYRQSYFGDYANTPEDPTVNTFVTINQLFLANNDTHTLIHEFSHNLGIIDYYDVTYSGIDAVGGYDMQSKNVGDFNAYSKLALGWMNPQVVSGLDSGQSVELTLKASALNDDVIVIPAAQSQYDGPFSEYIMIDLLSDQGTNQYDAAQFGLNGVSGVRISHVDARMEYRYQTVDSKVHPEEISAYEIGTVHYANDYDGAKGFYNIEVIQAGKKNTFSDLSNEITTLSSDDLFYAGDEFTVSEYSEFFYQGKMDDGNDFGYKIEILDISKDASGEPLATIRITAQ